MKEKEKKFDYGQIIVTIIVASVILLIIPTLLGTVMYNEIPTENWCRHYNETYYFVENHATEPSNWKEVQAHQYWCVKNETGWHLNLSRPMVLI